ncbi:MAG: hypothetical protein ACD_84C00035G0002 [uncultured bacterium]|nr:MAG: hypothetical protein ACD_84C00035G0002 [uncultured bacterium]
MIKGKGEGSVEKAADPKLIRYLILDTGEAVSELRRAITGLPNFTADEESIMKLIFSLLKDEVKAEENVAYEFLDIVSGSRETEYEDDMVRIVKAMMLFAIIAHSQLRFLNAYTKGQLFFRFACTINADVMLVSDV